MPRWESSCVPMTPGSTRLLSTGMTGLEYFNPSWKLNSVEGQRVSVSGFGGHMVSVAATHICLSSMKAAIYVNK